MIDVVEEARILRMEEEHKELNERLIKLSEFLGGTIFKTLDTEEQNDLKNQHYHMTGYHLFLEKRINRSRKRSGSNG